MLTIPEYIRRLEIDVEPVLYSWNDADPGSIHRQDERLATLIAKATDRAVVALSCGFAEWIAWRLHKKVNVLVLLHEIEATWAGIIDWRYLVPLSRADAAPRKREWTGPERGPIYSTFHLLADVAWRARKPSYTAEASSCLSALAAHVLADPAPFLEWRKEVMRRLITVYPFDLKDRGGPPVPRELLDPEYDFRPGLSKQLLSGFLQSLDHTRNPFLRSPAEMIADGFQGMPYQL
jgi:hypothetical protein